MKELIVIIGTTLLGCYIFSRMIGGPGTLEYEILDLILKTVGAG